MAEEIENVVLRIRQGDEDSFMELYKLTANYVYKIAYVYLLSKEDAEDVMQDTFLKLYSIRRRLDPSKSVLAFIKKITINYALKTLNRKKNISYPGKEVLDGEIFDETMHQDIKDAILKLDFKDRAVISLYYFDNSSLKEISFVLNESESAIKTRLFRAREKLKEVIKDGEI